MKKYIYVILVVSLFSSCHTNHWDIDISDIEINQDFKRFDIDLFSINKDSVWSYVPVFEKKYGSFFDIYNQRIINIGETNNFNYADKLLSFITDPYISEAYNTGYKLFKNNAFFPVINDAFKRYHHYFPDKNIPAIYTHISGFNQSLVVDSAFISISLDKYLGSKSKFYSMLRTPMYLRKNMHPKKIPTDVIMALGLTEFLYDDSKNNNLAHQMIYYGKIHLFIDALLPNSVDTLKWGMSEKKLKWCVKNERQMWLYVIENKLLFSSDYKDIKRFIDEGPFTKPFSKESPARTGQWLGYQIVKSYMKHNKNITLKELMLNDNYQQILDQAKYKP
jgi:hypothetical protein